LLALEGEENILPLQSEYFTNLYILRNFLLFCTIRKLFHIGGELNEDAQKAC